MTPFFSIVVPCYKVEPFIRECLDSIRKQSFRDWECIVVVQRSADKTEEIVREIAAQDDRIRFFVLPPSGSPSASRNLAIDRSAGEYIVFVDGDDYILDNALERISERIKAHPGADLYPCAVLVDPRRYGKEEIWDGFPPDSPEEMTGPEVIINVRRRFDSYANYMVQPMICRRGFLNETGTRFVFGLKHEDTEFLPRLLYRAKRVVPLHEVYYFYRMTQNSITTSSYPPGYELKHIARVKRNLMAFHAKVSREPGFDPRVSEYWANQWIGKIYGRWFYPWVIDHTPRRIRGGTLRYMLEGEMDDFLLLVKSAPFTKKLMSRVLLLFVRHPSSCAWFSECLFRIFFFLSERKSEKSKVLRGRRFLSAAAQEKLPPTTSQGSGE